MPPTAAVIRAQRLALAALKARKLAEREAHDAAIRALWAAGYSCARIAGRLGIGTSFVHNRVRTLGLPKRPHGFRHFHAGLSADQLELYRFYRRQQYPAAEARAEALRWAR